MASLNAGDMARIAKAIKQPDGRSGGESATLIAVPVAAFWFILLPWAAVLALSIPAVAQPAFPELTGRVVDRADILDADAEARLTRSLRAHEGRTGNQVVVVTLGSLQGYTIEDFGLQLGRHWGIGREGVDDGVLLIVAPVERAVRIEVGYGLEGTLTDALAATIIQTEILPEFRTGNLQGGVLMGVRSILESLSGSYVAPEPEWRWGNYVVLGIVILLGTVFVGYWLFVIGFLARDMVKGGAFRRGSGYWKRAFQGSGSSSSRRSSGFSGGGGSFGGGGASGRW